MKRVTMRDRYGLARVVVSLFTLPATVTVPLANASASAAPGLRATTKSCCLFTLTFGMPEHMWTPVKAERMHPQAGELVLNGPMAQAMPMGGAQRELEVRISSPQPVTPSRAPARRSPSPTRPRRTARQSRCRSTSLKECVPVPPTSTTATTST
jgi:hypothetical protein